MATQKQRQEFAKVFSANLRQFLSDIKELNSNLETYDDLTLSGSFTQEDFSEGTGLEYLTPDNLGSAVYSVEQIVALLETGHRVNIRKVVL